MTTHAHRAGEFGAARLKAAVMSQKANKYTQTMNGQKIGKQDKAAYLHREAAEAHRSVGTHHVAEQHEEAATHHDAAKSLLEHARQMKTDGNQSLSDNAARGATFAHQMAQHSSRQAVAASKVT
jgi:hypothetical protein